MKHYLLGLDNGGTVCKAAVFDLEGRQVLKESIQIPLAVNKNGRTERDLGEIAAKNLELIGRITAALDGEIIAVGLSGHGKGLYMLDKQGQPLGGGIGSTDSRALGIQLALADTDLPEKLRPLTQQEILACQPVCLLKWLKANDRATYDRIGAVLSVKDFVGYVLTGEIAAERTDVSGTNLLSLQTGAYDPAITALFDIAEIDGSLPPVIGSFAVRGHVTADIAAQTGLRAGIPVSGGMFDIDACALGVGTLHQNDLCAIVGTWSINEYISPKPLPGVMNSFWCVDGLYLVEESSAASAGNLEWVRGLLRERSYREADALVASVDPRDSYAVFFPFLFASNLHPLAKSAIVGLESGHSEAEVLRAVYEGVVFSAYTHLERLFARMDTLPDRIKLTGGIGNSPLWCQMFADTVGLPVEVSEQTEVGCKGAAMSAGVAAGIYATPEEAAARCVRPGRMICPDAERTAIYRQKYALYRTAEAGLAPYWQAANDLREANAHA